MEDTDTFAAVTEAVKNADVVSMLQKIVATSTQDEEAEEIREKIQNVLDRYNDMSEGEKGVFVEQLKEALAMKLSMKMQENFAEDASYLPLWIAAFVVVFILVFFGYKLYKSIKEKEIKREEKKKQKQSKKKK
ncbi:unnamed protein product [Leptosia nina]|uniref:Uncharacterized protein n=1 Tax=Leptosia nina TaxID=320188 RepID=A0AAV1JJ83_9NEOP